MEKHTVYELFTASCICGLSLPHCTETGVVTCLAEDGVNGWFGKQWCCTTYITAVVVVVVVVVVRVIISTFFFYVRDSLTAEWPITNYIYIYFFFHETTAASGPRSLYRGFTITLRHTTVGRTPLDEWPARRPNLYLTTHNTHKRQASTPPAAFEPKIQPCERPPTYALGRG